MSQLSAKRDASYITRRNAAVAVNASYTEAKAAVDANSIDFLKFQNRNTFSADLLKERDLGCYTCTQNSNVTAKGTGNAYDPNILPKDNGTFPTSGGVNNAGSS